MENRETRQISEFKLIDEHGKEYTVYEHLKWIKAGSSWFSLGDFSPTQLPMHVLCWRGH
jgi:hypothetical protein